MWDAFYLAISVFAIYSAGSIIFELLMAVFGK